MWESLSKALEKSRYTTSTTGPTSTEQVTMSLEGDQGAPVLQLIPRDGTCPRGVTRCVTETRCIQSVAWATPLPGSPFLMKRSPCFHT